jgi:hypothetical protein
MNTGMSHPTVWRMKRRLLIGRKLLVVVDPVSSYLGKTDSHKNSEVRGVLEPLSEMAERTRIAILSVTHFSKAGANNTAKALHRFIGSIAFTGAPRAAFAVIEDAEHDGRRLLLHAKNNLAPPPTGWRSCWSNATSKVTSLHRGFCGTTSRWRSRPMRRSPPKRLERKAARQRRRRRPFCSPY